MRKLDKCATEINENFVSLLADEFLKKFNVPVETKFNLFSMSLVTTRVDEKDFTPEEHAWVSAFSDGYSAALGVARELAWADLCKPDRKD